jgi:hypothetical protein
MLSFGNSKKKIINFTVFSNDTQVRKDAVENQEIKYCFHDIYENFYTNTNTNSLEIDLPRLNVIFYLCNSLFESEIHVQIKNIQDFKFFIEKIKQKYQMDVSIFKYFCNQDIFGWVFYILSKLYSDFEQEESNVLLLDHDESEKLIKLSFSKDLIFYFLFGTFKLLKCNKKKNTFEKLHNIDYYVTIEFEIHKQPEYIHLHWIFSD